MTVLLDRSRGLSYYAGMIGARRGDPRVDRWDLPKTHGWCGATVSEFASRARAPVLDEHRKGPDSPLMMTEGQPRFWGTGIGRAGWFRRDARVTLGDVIVWQRPAMHVGVFAFPGSRRAFAHWLGIDDDARFGALFAHEGMARDPPPLAFDVFHKLEQKAEYLMPGVHSLTLGELASLPEFISLCGNGPFAVCGFNVRPREPTSKIGVVSWHGAFQSSRAMRIPTYTQPGPTPRGQVPRENPNGERMPRTHRRPSAVESGLIEWGHTSLFCCGDD